MKFARQIKYVGEKGSRGYWVQKKVGHKGNVHVLKSRRTYYSSRSETVYCDNVLTHGHTWQRWSMKGKFNPYLKLPEEDAALLILTGNSWPPPQWLLKGRPCIKCFRLAGIKDIPPSPHCSSCECFGYRSKEKI